MPRLARPCTPGFPHHLISRFQDRRFRLVGASERAGYLECLRRACKTHEHVRSCAYGLMSSHVHNVALGDREPLGDFLHSLGTAFGLWLNKYEGGLGKVFAERPRSIPVFTEEGLARLIAYVHNNPVRAGVVACPLATDWTSHRAFVGEAPAPPYLDVEWALAAMGFSSAPSGRLSFHDYVSSRAGLPRDPLLSGPASSSKQVAQRLLASTARYFELESDELARPSNAYGLSCRLHLIATAKRVFGLSNLHIAQALHISTSLVSRLRQRAELDEVVAERLVDAYLVGSGE